MGLKNKSKKNILLYYLFLLTIVVNGQSDSKFNQNEYVWDLSEIYETDNKWTSDYKDVSERISTTNFQSITAFRSSKELFDVLDELSKLRVKTSKVAFYAILRWEEGKVDNGEAFLENGEKLLADFEALLADLEGKILAVDSKLLAQWITADENLIKHRHWLNQIIDQKKYRSTPQVEYVLRKTRDWISSSVSTYWDIQSINKLWSKVKNPKGEETLLNRGIFRSVRSSNELTYRDKVAKNYYQSLDTVSELLGNLYTRKIKSELDLAKLRGFDDGIDANWFFYGGCPEGTYRNIVKVARNHVDVLQRYVELRGKILNKGKMTYLDFYRTPKALENYQYSFDKSMRIALEASERVGSKFHKNMKFAFENKHWMHLADVPKTARYHIRPAVTGVHPFFILKYKPAVTESRALVGGLFSLAVDVASIGQDGIDVFETEAPVHISGSIYAGDILFDRLTAIKSEKKDEKIAHLLQSLEFLRRFFRNAIFIELDSKIQNLIAEGQPINGKEISSVYLALLKEYYGDDKKKIDIPEYLKNDWMTETAVLFMPKYEHHFWAPSLAVGAAMATNKQFEALYLSRYSGDRYDSYSILKKEGFDLKNPSSYSYLFDLMNMIMDEIDKELSE